MTKQRFQHIPIADLYHDPDNSLAGRDVVDDLVSSIGESGLIHPLVVAKVKGEKGYKVIAGNRRFKALGILADQQVAGFEFDSKIPCLVVPADANHAVLALVENRIRVDWSPIDEALAFARANKEGATIADLAAIFAASERYVRQRLQLANLNPEWQLLVREGKAPLGIAAIVASMDHDEQTAFLQQNANDVGRLSPWSVRRFMSARQEWHAVDGKPLFDWTQFSGEWRVDLFGTEGQDDGEPVYYVKDKNAFLQAQRHALVLNAEADLEERKQAVAGSPAHYPTWFVIELWSDDTDQFASAEDVAGDEEEIDHERGMGLLYLINDTHRFGKVDVSEVYAIIDPEAAAEEDDEPLIDETTGERIVGQLEQWRDPETGEVDEGLEADRRMLNGDDLPPWEDSPATTAAAEPPPAKVVHTVATAPDEREFGRLVSQPVTQMVRHIKLARIIGALDKDSTGPGQVLLSLAIYGMGEFNSYAKVAFGEGSSYGEPLAGVHDILTPILEPLLGGEKVEAVVRAYSWGNGTSKDLVAERVDAMQHREACHLAAVIALLRWNGATDCAELDRLAGRLGTRMSGYIPSRDVLERFQKGQLIDWAKAANIAVDTTSKRSVVADLTGALERRDGDGLLPRILLFPADLETSTAKALAAE